MDFWIDIDDKKKTEYAEQRWDKQSEQENDNKAWDSTKWR